MVEIILLLIGAYLAAALSGAAGFGGALLLLPLLTHVVGVAVAVPLLTVAQLVGNLARAGFGWRQIRWRAVALFLAAAVPFAVLGAHGFVALPKSLVGRLIGATILLFVILRAVGLARFRAGPGVLLAGGAVVGGVSGLVGSAGPLGAAIFLTLDLPALGYVASEAATAIAMHAVKLVVYGVELRLTPRFWILAAALGVAMVLGTWSSRKLIARMPPKAFQRMAAVLLVVISIQMILTG
jgi:uncharacterized membrane protein YfcA